MSEKRKIAMGTMQPEWMSGKSKSITFCVTEDCNLACKYCYMTGKNSFNRMDFNTAKKAVDYILSSNDKEFEYEGVVWDFIGGEPFIEIKLIDQISEYIKLQMFLLNHRWFNCYRFNFATNGLLYAHPDVQQYIKKNRGHISIGISIDGNKTKHDLSRVRPNGTGSYDDVVKNVKLWQEQFPGASTKATFSHADLPYLKDSIINLWDLGLKLIPANLVFENSWQEGDDAIFENELKELADYIIEKELWWDHSVRFFDPKYGTLPTKDELNRNFCGTGNMLAIDVKGNLFPCIRFYDISLNNKKPIIIGDVEKGIDHNKMRPFKLLSYLNQSTDECNNCEIGGGCSWCTGNNYDSADTNTLYQRATYICKMHKANVRANDYLWNRIAEKIGYIPDERIEHLTEKFKTGAGKHLYLITSDKITPHCSYINNCKTNEVMNEEVLKKSIDFSQQNGFKLVYLGLPVTRETNNESLNNSLTMSKAHGITTENHLQIFDNEFKDLNPNSLKAVILLINKEKISALFSLAKKLLDYNKRLEIRLQDIENWEDKDLKVYQEQLSLLSGYILESYRIQRPSEVNILTDILNLEVHKDCGAGETSFAVAPNGKIYFCPAFYFDDPESYVGSLETGLNVKNSQLLKIQNAPICSKCDAFHCARCKFLNTKLTYEVNTPSKIQCVISHIERNAVRNLQISIIEATGVKFDNIIKEIDYLDPLDYILKNKAEKEGNKCF